MKKTIVVIFSLLASFSSFAQEETNKYQIDVNPIIGMNGGDIYGIGIASTFQYFVTNRISMGIDASYTRYPSDEDFTGEAVSSSNTITIGPLVRYNIFYNKWSFYAGASYNYYNQWLDDNSVQDENYALDPDYLKGSMLSPHLGANYKFNNWGVFAQVDYETYFPSSEGSTSKSDFEYSLGVFFKF